MGPALGTLGSLGMGVATGGTSFGASPIFNPLFGGAGLGGFAGR